MHADPTAGTLRRRRRRRRPGTSTDGPHPPRPAAATATTTTTAVLELLVHGSKGGLGVFQQRGRIGPTAAAAAAAAAATSATGPRATGPPPPPRLGQGLHSSSVPAIATLIRPLPLPPPLLKPRLVLVVEPLQEHLLLLEEPLLLGPHPLQQ